MPIEETIEEARRRECAIMFRTSGLRVIEHPGDPFRVCGQAWYYQSGVTGVTAICVYTPNFHEWAAYIGGSERQTEEEVIDAVLRHGAKLSEKDARVLFPCLHGVAYRR